MACCGGFIGDLWDGAVDIVEGVGGAILDAVEDVGDFVADTVEAIVDDPKKLLAVGLSVAFPGAGAALGAQLGLTGAAAQVVGQSLINTAFNGGDVKSAVLSAAIPVMGGPAAEQISKTISDAGIDGALNKVVTNAATKGLTAAVLNQDIGDALISSLVQSAPSVVSQYVPQFAELPRAVQEAAVTATSDLLRTGGTNLESIALSGVANAATDYAIKNVQGYDDLRPGQKEIVRNGVSNLLQGKNVTATLLNGAISFGQEAVQNEINENTAKDAGWADYKTQQAAKSMYGSKVTPELYADKQETTEAEAKDIARQILGREPTEFEYMQLIGLPENEAAQNSDLAAIKYDESTFDSNELAEAYKAKYGKEPTAEWLASDEAMDMLGRSEAQGQNLLDNFYIKDKNWVTEDEAKQFWKDQGNTGPIPQDLMDSMLLNSESGARATAETYTIRQNDIKQTTFDGAGYGSAANARKAAEAAGFNSYTWQGVTYTVPPSVGVDKVQDRRRELVSEVLKSQGTTIAKATDEQYKSATDLVKAVPAGMLGNATLQDIVSGKYTSVNLNGGPFRVDVNGMPYVSERLTDSDIKKTITDQVPPGFKVASSSDVWDKDYNRVQSDARLVTLPDGRSVWVLPALGADTELPPSVTSRGTIEELEVSDPEAWLQLASKFENDATGTLPDYLVNTANALMLGAYATGNKDFGDNVKQTLSIVTQGVGEQTENLAKFFADRLGLSYDNAVVQAGKALKDWGAANQTASTKKQEEDFANRIKNAEGVLGKLQAIPGAIYDYPGGFTTMVLKEGVQEFLPLWAAKSVAQLGRLVSHSANTAVEVMEVWGNGAGETYSEALKMGYSEQDARVMASKVGLQSAAITAVTNGIGDIPLVNRVIGGAVEDSLTGITKAGVREGITEYFDELGQNAAKQYQLTGKVNWDQATTAATIGMGVGAGTTSGIMLGASINSTAVIGKDFAGKDVSYADFMSGDKQVDMKTLNLNAQVGTAKDGDAITLGSITAMPMASGISYDMVTSGLPPALTNQNVIVGLDALGNQVTLSELMSGVTSDSDFASAYSSVINTTPEQRVEAQKPVIEQALKDAGLTTYSAADIDALINSNPKGTNAVIGAAQTYAGPRVTTTSEAAQMLRDAGYDNPTAEEIAGFVGSVPESESANKVADYVSTRLVTEADAKAFFESQGYTPNKDEIAQFVRQGADVVKNDIQQQLNEYVDQRQITQAEAEQFFQDFGYNPTPEELASYVRQGADINQDAVRSELEAYVDPRMVTEQEVRDAYAELGLDAPTQADINKLVGQYDQELLSGKAEENLDTARYNSLRDQMVSEEEIQDIVSGAVGSKTTTPTTDDVTEALRVYQGKQPFDAKYDWDGDGKVDLSDTLNLLKSSLGKPTTVPAAEDSFWNQPTGIYKEIKDAIAGIEFPASLTKDDVTDSVAKYMEENPGLSVEDVVSAIGTYMTANPGLTAADLDTAISDATKGLATTEQVGAVQADVDALEKLIGSPGGADAEATGIIGQLEAMGLTDSQILEVIGAPATETEPATGLYKAADDAAVRGENAAGAVQTELSKIIGAPSVADDPNTPDVDESSAATGLYKQIEAGNAASQDAIKGVKDLIGEAGKDDVLGTGIIGQLEAMGLTDSQILGVVGKPATETEPATGLYKAAEDAAVRGESAAGAVQTELSKVIGAPSVKDDPATLDVDESLAASGLYKQIEDSQAETAKQVGGVQADVDALEKLIGEPGDGDVLGTGVFGELEALGLTDSQILGVIGAPATETEPATGLYKAADDAAVRGENAAQAVQIELSKVIGAPSVKDDPATLDIDESLAATGLYGQIEASQSETAGAINTLSKDVQDKYDALTDGQKALARDMASMGLSLTAAIDLAAKQTQAQITGLGQQVDTRINELMKQGDTYQVATQKAIGELNTQNQQLQGLIGNQGRSANQSDIDALSQMLGGQRDMDLTYDVTGDKQITQADIDFLTGVVGGTNTDWKAPVGSAWGATGLYGQLAANEAQRQADLQAQLAREEAARQAAIEAERQGKIANIKSTAAQGGQDIQALGKQLPKAFETTSTPLYGTMEYFDPFGDPFADPFGTPKMRIASSTNPADQTKMAAGGYIDDLLAGEMTVDDLLNLLR